jgi:amidase
MNPDTLTDPLCFSSVRAFAAAIQRRELTSEAIVRTCLERIDAVNAQLNAVVRIANDTALARAREADAATARGERWGPLHGVPMTIKDSLDTAGVVTTGGTQGRASFVPEHDATVVERLRRAGAILLGKTNTPEFTLAFETDNLVYGRTSNPYDLSRTSGGSSGGAGAIVAAGGAPFDIGSDYGGSIRVPAHCCGIAGIKPTSGRVPRTGHVLPFGGLQDTFQQIGPLARYVDDLALLLPLIAGPDTTDPAVLPMPYHDPQDVDLSTLQIAMHTDNGVMTPTPETVQAVEAAANALAPAVRGLEQVRPPGIEETLDIGLGLFMWDGGAAVRRLLRECGTDEHTLHAFTEGRAATAEELDRLIARWYAFRSRLHTFMADNDVIVCPANAKPALPHGATADPDALAAYSYTVAYNLTGWPAAVVRAGTSPEGLPIGVQIVARPGREDVALAVASLVETALGGYQRPAL